MRRVRRRLLSRALPVFAFSAVAGAILLRIFKPKRQCRYDGLQYRRCAAQFVGAAPNIHGKHLLLIVGGAWHPACDLPAADRGHAILRVAFGSSSHLCRLTMLFRRRWRGCRNSQPRLTALIGVGGGLVGGLDDIDARQPTIGATCAASEERHAGWSAVHRYQCRCWLWRCFSSAKPVVQSRDRPRHPCACLLVPVPRHCAFGTSTESGFPDQFFSIAGVRRFARLGVRCGSRPELRTGKSRSLENPRALPKKSLTEHAQRFLPIDPVQLRPPRRSRQVGLRLQPGQDLLLTAPSAALPLVRRLPNSLQAGAVA